MSQISSEDHRRNTVWPGYSFLKRSSTTVKDGKKTLPPMSPGHVNPAKKPRTDPPGSRRGRPQLHIEIPAAATPSSSPIAPRPPTADSTYTVAWANIVNFSSAEEDRSPNNSGGHWIRTKRETTGSENPQEGRPLHYTHKGSFSSVPESFSKDIINVDVWRDFIPRMDIKIGGWITQAEAKKNKQLYAITDNPIVRMTIKVECSTEKMRTVSPPFRKSTVPKHSVTPEVNDYVLCNETLATRQSSVYVKKSTSRSLNTLQRSATAKTRHEVYGINKLGPQNRRESTPVQRM